jgi:integrase
MSAEEIARILDRTTNLKHWTILATFYATALRCNELLHLKLSDIVAEQVRVNQVFDAGSGLCRVSWISG